VARVLEQVLWQSSVEKKSNGKPPLAVRDHPLEGTWLLSERQDYLQWDIQVRRLLFLYIDCENSGPEVAKKQFVSTSV